MTERKGGYTRRELIEGCKELVFGGITLYSGMQIGREITAEELQKRASFLDRQAQRIINDALSYTTKIEQYDEKIKALVPPLVIIASIPGEEKPLCAFGLYEVTSSMICDNQEFLDAIDKAVTLLIPRSFLGTRKIKLDIQLVKRADKPQKPEALIEQTNSDLSPNLERHN